MFEHVWGRIDQLIGPKHETHSQAYLGIPGKLNIHNTQKFRGVQCWKTHEIVECARTRVCVCVCVYVCVFGPAIVCMFVCVSMKISLPMFGGIGKPNLVRNAASLQGTCPVL